VTRTYQDFVVNFDYFASIKGASKAQHKGVENKMLNNSISLLKKRTGTNDCVIFDVGANFGYLTLVWARSLSKYGKVIAFEPNANVNKTLSKSIRANVLENTVRLEQLAVGSEEKEIELFLENTTSNVVESDNSGSSIKLQMTSIDKYISNHNVSRCDLIKIDVDGIELDILNGSVNALEEFQPIYIVETNDDHKIIDFFKQKNYTVLDATLNPYKDGEKLPPNIFCVPNN
ncbi:MAG: FkbM family methyltransferase, partial [Flavobacteriaceae bacterium]|nr:FkbM family methyltransferase [Flavobacteriaceae bacterium]